MATFFTAADMLKQLGELISTFSSTVIVLQTLEIWRRSVL